MYFLRFACVLGPHTLCRSRPCFRLHPRPIYPKSHIFICSFKPSLRMAVLGHALDCLSLFLSLNHSWRGQHGAATVVESSATSTKGFPVCRRKEACEDLGAVAFASECVFSRLCPASLRLTAFLCSHSFPPRPLCSFASAPACSPLTPE